MKKKEPTFKLWARLNYQEQMRVVLVWLVGVAVVISGLSAFEDGQLDWRSLGGNLGTELIGAAMTFYIFDKLLVHRDQEQLKAMLIRQMGSRVNHEALRAVEELRAHGWLEDGSLEGAKLWRANLEGVDLGGANLVETWLVDTNLANARLAGANLHGMVSVRANFSGVWLVGTNLEGAKLLDANLEAAWLGGANLEGVDLRQAKFDEETILPDGSKWEEGADMERFTNRKHEEFWRSDYPESPAYGGKRIS